MHLALLQEQHASVKSRQHQHSTQASRATIAFRNTPMHNICMTSSNRISCRLQIWQSQEGAIGRFDQHAMLVDSCCSSMRSMYTASVTRMYSADMKETTQGNLRNRRLFWRCHTSWRELCTPMLLSSSIQLSLLYHDLCIGNADCPSAPTMFTYRY